MENLKRPYEISLWEDILTWVRVLKDEDNTQKIEGDATEISVDPVSNPDWFDFSLLTEDKYEKELSYYIKDGDKWKLATDAEPNYQTWYIANIKENEIFQYYKEYRICTIGSNTMDTPIRAHEPSLVSNVNGSNTLTFKMYSSYWDDDAEDFRDNPFIDFLVNERKIKLRVDEEADVKWYDFIIKNIEQDSESKVFTYTAIDIFINELSKSGFNLEFDSELGNNMGTITDLGKKVLDESDWSVKEEGNDLIR